MSETKIIKIEEPKKSRLKSKFIEWSQSSTSHGYSNIFRTKNLILRTMWFLFFLTGLSVAIYMVSRSILEYLNFDVTTKIRKLKTDTLVFPAVTICNINPFVTQAGANYVIEYFSRKYNRTIKNATDLVNVSVDIFYDMEELRMFVASPSFNSTLRQSFGFSADEMILFCDFNSLGCDYNEIERLVQNRKVNIIFEFML